MKSLGQHVLDVILKQKLITAKYNSTNRHVSCVSHSHSADQIEKAIREYLKEKEKIDLVDKLIFHQY